MLLQHAKIFRTTDIVLPRREPEITENRIIFLVRIVLIMTGVAIVTGTIVTGSGPHAGDENAIRINLAINVAARIHSVSVLICLATADSCNSGLFEAAVVVSILALAVVDAIWSCVAGLLVPIPTLPEESMRMRSVEFVVNTVGYAPSFQTTLLYAPKPKLLPAELSMPN